MLAASSEFVLPTDWDETLFRTNEFSKDFLCEFASLAGVSIEQVWADATRHRTHPVLGGYDLDKHGASYELEIEHVWNLYKEIVQSRDYLYGDSVAYIEELQADGFNPWILSYGNDRVQREKIEPYLHRFAGIPFKIVLQRKADYLTSVHPSRQGALVDDAPDQRLPEGFTEITINRASELTEPEQVADRFVVASLSQALQVIRSLTS